MLRLLALISCGTRSVIDAVSGPASSGETTYAGGLLSSLHAGMVLLADRNFGAGFLAAQVAGTEADFLIRVRTGSRAPALPVMRRLPDGSWLSRFGGIPVRVIDAGITITTSAGRATGHYRLVTTLTDPARYPAGELVTLYHERWEIETAYLELKSTIPGGRVLRARTPDGVDQEVWALLVTYQALRTAMTDAAGTVPGTDPDRASFTVALQRRPRPGHPGRRRHRRPRYRPGREDRPPRPGQPHAQPPARTSPRVVKRAISKYNARGTIDRATYKATIAIEIIAAPLTASDAP